MALERVPADIRKEGGVARMADPKIIKEIMSTVSIPVMAKCRIGHFAEAQILETLGVDFIDDAECGDLAFFDNDEDDIIHVGILLNNSKIIHSSGFVRIDSIDHNGIFNEDIGDYSHKLRIIKRFL